MLAILALRALPVAVAWCGWHAFVLRRASHATVTWGPRWLAVGLSSLLHGFGSWLLNFSHDTQECLQRGLFERDSQYIIVWHPHGAFTVTALYFLSNWWARDYPKDGLFVCVADLLLRVPFLSEFLLLCNARSGTAPTFNALLAKGRTVAIQPGGIAEQVATDAEHEVVYFPPRLGFVRLALKYGTPLLPIYAFGENQLYDTTPGVRKLNAWLYKTFRIGTLFVWGRLGLLTSPMLPNPLLLPAKGRGLHVRWGEPVEVGPADPEPSDEKVQAVFERYVAALQKLFNEHKDKCLPPAVAARGLEVIVRGGGGGGSERFEKGKAVAKES